VNILFINPPDQHEILSCNPEIIKEERGYNPPLGLLYLAAYLESHSNHTLRVIDAQVDQLSYAQLENEIKQAVPEVVCMTMLTFTVLDVLKTAEMINGIDPDIRVVVGGTHPQIYPEETIRYPHIDYIILGEGEPVLHQLIYSLETGERFPRFPGLVYVNDGQIIHTGIPALIDDLDALPFPARHLTPYHKYYTVISKASPVTTMFTSRGCPFQCNFCDRPNMGKKFRYRSATNVVDEMEVCEQMGIKEILMYDDTFTVHKPRVIDICDEYLRRGLTVRWDIRARVDTMTGVMLEKLKAANCTRIHYGVEAGTDRVLKVLNKGITIETVKDIFQLTKEKGLSMLSYFMIGSPTETRGDVLATIRFACKLPADYTQFTIFTPFPATQFYSQGLASGLIKEDYWLAFAKNPTSDFRTPYWQENLSLDEIMELTELAYRRFYLRPLYVLRKIFQLKSWAELRRKCKAGLTLLTSRNKHV